MTTGSEDNWLGAGQRRPALTVGILLTDAFTLNACAGFVDALRLAADTGGRSRQIKCGWRIMGSNRSPVRSSSTVEVLPNSPLYDPKEFDYIAVCGGNDYDNAGGKDGIHTYLRRAQAAGVSLIGICTGTFELARAGLMNGKTACVHWNVSDGYRMLFPSHETCVDRIFLEDGNVISCAGSAGAVDLALYLIRRHLGVAKSHQCMRHMMLTSMRPSSYPQANLIAGRSAINDLRVLKAVQFVEQHLDDAVKVGQIAEYLGVSTRQLERLFREQFGIGPAAYLRRTRTTYASWLLEHSDEKVSSIALDCGFSDAAHFSREFKSLFHCTPRQFRLQVRHRYAAMVASASVPSDALTI